MNAPPSADQKLWKVSVLCEGVMPADIDVKNPKPSRIARRYTTVLVQAPDSSNAMEAGKAYADANATPDVRWGSFTPMSASQFVLPIALEDFQ
jgi:hypothetical protein